MRPRVSAPRCLRMPQRRKYPRRTHATQPETPGLVAYIVDGQAVNPAPVQLRIQSDPLPGRWRPASDVRVRVVIDEPVTLEPCPVRCDSWGYFVLTAAGTALLLIEKPLRFFPGDVLTVRP